MKVPRPARGTALALLGSLLISPGCGKSSSAVTPVARRTVSGGFELVYSPQGATPTTIATPPLTSALDRLAGIGHGYRFDGLLVPDGTAAGYTTFAGTLGADYRFSISDVPEGSYFLALSRDCTADTPSGSLVRARCLILTELSASQPDLATASACRPDAALPTQATTVQLALTGLAPWTPGGGLGIASAQACLANAPITPRLDPVPQDASTSYVGAGQWSDALPDAARGDASTLFQTVREAVAGGTARTIATASAASLAGFSLADGGTGTVPAALAPPATTASVRLDLRWSQFAALASSVHPTATPARPGQAALPFVSVLAFPQGRAVGAAVTVAGAAMLGTAAVTADADLGTLSYGRFLATPWREIRKAVYSYWVSIPDPGSASPIELPVDIRTYQWIDASLPAALTPVVSPPHSPRIAGRDAFAQQTGVGLQPVISWSPPAVGSPTSYFVAIDEVEPVEGGTANTSATVRTGTSFRVPAGVLRAGGRYLLSITARLAGGDGLDRLVRDEDDSYATCVSAVFSP